SVYIENTVEVIRQVAPHVKPGSLLMDVTSVKVEPCRAMKKFARRNVEIIGTHPMFGPRITSIEGLTFIVIPIRTKKWDRFLLDFLKNQKAKVFITTPEEHDRIMGVVQGLTHFAYIATAATLRELNIDVRYSKNFASPIYGLMLDLIARIVGQSPQLYASIQMHNPVVKKVHKSFVRQAQVLRDVVAKKDMAAFAKIMTNAAKHIGDIDASMGRSDKAILALTEELKKLGESINKEVALKHIYSGAVHVGKVKGIDADSVVLLTPSGKEVALKLSNVELLGSDFLRRWKLKNLPRTKRDFSVLLPENADEEIIKKIIEACDGRVISCSIIDTYKGKQVPQGRKSITFRVEAFDLDFENVKKILKGIGGTLR
ncbi:MAG: prephenate dehydrogenase, partial [Candidatus Hydrothermarchaeota archaeon]|nr:prephenate dehydrogenase [Candidatus Hydrothermarchaeota archaeon]